MKLLNVNNFCAFMSPTSGAVRSPSPDMSVAGEIPPGSGSPGDAAAAYGVAFSVHFSGL